MYVPSLVPRAFLRSLKELLRTDHPELPHSVKVFEVVNGGTAIVNGRTFCVVQEGNGVPDGIRCDAKGNLWACCGDGINICASGPLPQESPLPPSSSVLLRAAR